MTAPTRRRPAAAGRPGGRPGSRRPGRRSGVAPRVRRLVLVVAAVLAAALTVAGVLSSRLLAVTSVQVVGLGRLTAPEVLAVASVRPGTPLARLDTAAVRERVARLPAVAGLAGVTVARHWPHTVVIRVVERVPVAAIARDDGSWQLVDDTGQAVAVDRSAGGLPRLALPAADTPPEATRAAIQVVVRLPDTLRGLVADVSATSPTTVTLHLKDGRTVVWGAPAAPATKAATVLALLPRPQRTIDVSSPSVVVVR